MTAGEMEKCLQDIVDMAGLVYAKETYWKVSAMELIPPAQDEAIIRLSRELPFPLPASYVQFLKLHDGCLNFWPSFALLGTKGQPREIVEAEIEDAREHQSEFAADEDGTVTPASIARFETPTEETQEFFLPNHVVFGANEGQEFFMFNEKNASGEEYEVIHYVYAGGVYYRYADFPSFLTATAQQLKERIKKKGYAKKE
jgi:hypothetical protein